MHYNGWGSKYDQWISEDSINKDNEVNRALMKYKNRGEEGVYKQHSILDEIVLDVVSLHFRSNTMIIRTNQSFPINSISCW